MILDRTWKQNSETEKFCFCLLFFFFSLNTYFMFGDLYAF